MNDLAPSSVNLQDMIDLAAVMMSQQMYYVERKTIKAIAHKLELPQDVIAEYVNIQIPDNERLNKIVNFVSLKCFNAISPLEKIIQTLNTEITSAKIENVPDDIDEEEKIVRLKQMDLIRTMRNRNINTLVHVMKSYSSMLDVLRRTHQVNEGGGNTMFQFNLIDSEGKIKVNRKTVEMDLTKAPSLPVLETASQS